MESQSFQRPAFSVFLALFVLFLVVSMHGATLTPFYSQRGLDFQNFHAFFNGYADPMNRPMIYPPLMVWVMSWCRGVDFYRATLAWEFVILVLTFLGTWIISLTEPKPQRWVWMVWILLFFQLPLVYSVERGNCDAVILPVFGLGIYLFWKEKLFFAGMAFALACWLKVYPIVPSFLFLAVLAASKDLRDHYFWKLLFGFAAGGVFFGAVLWSESFTYITEILPAYSKEHRLLIISSHSLFRHGPSWFLKVPVLILWGVMFTKLFRKDPIFVLTAGFAISTFFQGSSNDYSLITAYPFLFILVTRMLKPGIDWRRMGWLVFSFWVFIGDRAYVEWIFHSRGAIFVHVIWFLTFPFFMMKEEKTGEWTLPQEVRV